MTIGHPPPEPPPLRSRLAQRLTFLEEMVKGGLDGVIPNSSDLDAREACREQVSRYLDEARRYVSSLPDGGAVSVEMVLMDLPVCVEDQESGDTETFTVVGPDEVDATAGLISFLSPLGSNLLLKRVEETVVIEAPGGQFFYRVRSIGLP